MQRHKTAQEILVQLCRLRNSPDAKNILFVDKDGKLIDFNRLYMFDATQWTDDDIEEIERDPKKAANKAMEIELRYQ